MIDMKTRFPTFSDPERLRSGIDEFLEQVFYTDAILIYSPSQISLAAIIHSASTSKENVDEYITKILFSEDQKRLLNLIEAVKSKSSNFPSIFLVIEMVFPIAELHCLLSLLSKKSVWWCGTFKHLIEMSSKLWKRSFNSAAIPTTTVKAQRNCHSYFVNSTWILTDPFITFNVFCFRFKKRMKQSFDDEESFEDGQYPSTNSDQVRGMLMGMSEMGKI